ncbi:MAG: hypothetical protein ABIH76_00530 [Candidatus Bathyarchaeota archaeon]
MVNASEGSIMWQNEMCPGAFIDSENLLNLETRQMQPLLDNEAEKSAETYAAQKDKLLAQPHKTQLQDDKLTYLIRRFLLGDLRKVTYKTRTTAMSSAEQQTLTDFDKALKFHNPEDSLSVLEGLLNSGTHGFLIIRDSYLVLTDSSLDSFGSIELRTGRKHLSYSLRYGGALKSLCEKYEQELKARVANKIQKEVHKHENEKRALLDKLKISIQDIGEVNQKGFVTKQGSLFLYKIKPEFIITAHNLQPKVDYRFPSCKIGLQISYSRGHYRFEDPVRILEAKSMSHGKEKGEYQDLFNQDYLHPAGHIDSGKYPWLCIINGYDYPRNQETDIESFLTSVSSIFHQACGSIEHGYWLKDKDDNGKLLLDPSTGKPQAAIVYGHFSDNDFLNLLKDHEVK